MTLTLREFAERIAKNPKLVLADDYEIAVQSTKHTVSTGTERGCDDEIQSEDWWLSLRVCIRRQLGTVTGFVSSADNVEPWIDRAFSLASASSPDPWFRFPIWKEPSKRSMSEHAAFVIDDKVVYPAMRLTSEWEESETVLFRKSERLVLEDRFRFSKLTATIKVECEKPFEIVESRTGGKQSISAWLKNLVEQREIFARSPSEKGLPDGRILLCPSVASKILAVLSPTFLADVHEFGRTPLPFKRSQEVFSPAISIVDDGRHEFGRSCLFDLEGVLTQKKYLVRQGRWENLLYDSYLATRNNRLSTGNFLRHPEERAPAIHPSTLYIEGGDASRNSLADDLGEGSVIEQVAEITPLEGTRYAMECAGWRRTAAGTFLPFHGLRLECDLHDWFRRAIRTGNDLTFFGLVGSPSILIEKRP